MASRNRLGGAVVIYTSFAQPIRKRLQPIPGDLLQGQLRNMRLARPQRRVEMRINPGVKITARKPTACRQHRADQLVELPLVQPRDNPVEPIRATPLGLQRHLGPDRVDHQCALTLVDHLEARRDARLQWEPPEQSVAERMDRLDLQPARRLQRPREQPPRLR